MATSGVSVWARETSRMLGLAAPLALAQLAQSSLPLIDTLMVGRLGREELAAIALGALLFQFCFIIASGFLYAVSPLVAQAFGAGELDRCARTARQGLWLAAALSLPGLLVFLRAEAVLSALGQDPATAALAGRYLGAVAWGWPAALLFLALRGLLEGVSVSRPILVFTLAGVVLKVVANQGLMFGRFGLPALGLVGTGLATSLIYLAMFLTGALYVAVRFRRLAIFRRLRRPDAAVLGELLRLGWPIGLALGFEAGLFTVTGLFMGLVGRTELAAHQIAIQTVATTFMIPLGISLATTVRVGQASGRSDPEGVWRAALTGILLSCGVMCLTALLYWLAPHPIVGLYLDRGLPENGEVARFAALFLGFGALFQVFDGLQVTTAAALRGLQDTRIPMALTLVAYWLVGVPVGVLLAFPAGLGGPGLWLGLVVGLGVAAVLLVVRLRVLLLRLLPGSGGIRSSRFRSGGPMG